MANTSKYQIVLRSQDIEGSKQYHNGAAMHLGIRMHHKFPWDPDSCAALGLALYQQHICQGTTPSKTKDRTAVIQVLSCILYVASDHCFQSMHITATGIECYSLQIEWLPSLHQLDSCAALGLAL